MSEISNDALLQLDDYVRGQPEESLPLGYEEDLFARALAGQAPELGWREGLATTLRDMHARGTLDLWLSASDVQRLRESDLEIHFYELDPANPAPLVLSPDADLIVTKVLLDLTHIRSLEAEILSNEGKVLKRMPDIAFEPGEGAIYLCCEAELARTAASTQRITRIWAEDETGRRLLCELR